MKVNEGVFRQVFNFDLESVFELSYRKVTNKALGKLL
jgi:hypothetical protein